MTLMEIFEMLPDHESCISYLEITRWGEHTTCPHCGSDHVARRREKEQAAHWRCHLGRWNCYDCKSSFNVLSGTMFHKSKIPLQKWILGISFVINAKKSISSCQLARDLEMNQKTAWYMLTRIRAEMASQEDVLLQGIIEADETYNRS